MRWTARRKEEVVVALAQGLITVAEAKERHGLSDEELGAWARDYAAHGLYGLRATGLQQYRRGPAPAPWPADHPRG
jgi:transposase-like protein